MSDFIGRALSSAPDAVGSERFKQQPRFIGDKSELDNFRFCEIVSIFTEW